ncbi:fucose-binding lectin II, partial [Levilactobacillus parabrevis]|nr:fucose-binding lectin II [Levilactobacillus parabrevis]
MNKYIKSVLTSATLVITALTLSTTTNAASIRKASTSTIHSRIARTYSYAKKMIKENKTGLSGQSSSIFSKKLNPDTGAAAGYSDFLLGLKGNGYKFNTKEKTLLRKNLVIKK